MTKSDILDRFEELLQAEDITTVKAEIRDLQEKFRTAPEGETPAESVEPVVENEAVNAEPTEEPAEAVAADSPETQPEESPSEDGSEEEIAPESAEAVPAVNPVEARFKRLCNEFAKRVKKHVEAMEKQRQENLKIKEGLITELKALAENPDPHYKTLFQDFNRINETWRNTGHVPLEVSRDVNERYYHWKNVFFHDFRIHIEMRELDVKRNREHRQAIIAETESLRGIEKISDLIDAIDRIKTKWNEEGPVPPDMYKELADRFYGATKEYEERIRTHFQSIREEQDKNVAAKEALIERANGFVSGEANSHEHWKKLTDEVIALQNEWKNIGFVRRDRDEGLWKSFREACDRFFQAKDAFYKKADSEMDGKIAEKQTLIAKAKELKDSTSWGATTKEIQDLMEKWKAVGGVKRGIDNKLWSEFRKSIDEFFDKKKEHFGERKAEQENNLFKKNELISEVESFEISGDRSVDLGKLKEFNERWNAIGFVPKNDIDAIIKRFRGALDKHYKALDASTDEKQLARFRERLDSRSKDSHSIEREQRFLRDKIGQLKDEILRYEHNILVFTGAGAADLHNEIRKKIKNAEREIDQIKKKLDVLRTVNTRDSAA
jgi:hypothetical protein